MGSGARRWTRLLAVALAGIGLAACGGSEDVPAAPSAAPLAQTVGPEGGTLTGENGLAIAVPAGAVSGSVTIRMARDATGAPPIEAAAQLAGPTFALTPHGIPFARPAVVRIPFDPTTRPDPEAVPVLFKASPGGRWVALADTARDGDALLADVSSFSYFVVQWCRTKYGSSYVATTYVCSYAQRDVSIEVVSPVPPAPPPRRSGLGVLTPINPALQITRPSLLVLRVAVEALYATDTPSHTVEFEVIEDTGRVVAGGSFPSDELRIPPGRKTLDVTVPISINDNGLRTYRVEVFCASRYFSGSCTGGTVGGALFRTPELPPYRVAGNALLVNVAIAPSTPVDPAAPPLFDAAQSGFVRPAADGGGFVDTWTLPIGSASKFISLQATTLQQTDHTWQISRDGGTTWADWERSATWGSSFVSAVTRNVWQSSRQICVGFSASPCTNGYFPWFDRADINGLKFRVVAANFFGSTTGPTWTIASPQIDTAPAISGQPMSMRVTSGQTASFTVVATGAPAPSYQWQRRTPGSTSWLDIPGATSGTYTTGPLLLVDSSTLYRAKAVNVEGEAFSDPAAVVVDSGAIAPLISTQPQSLVVLQGSEAVYAVVADGTSPLSYQWRKNGVDITGANAPMLKLPATALADAGSYSVAITNPVGSVTSTSAALTVNASGPPTLVAPTIVTAPASATVNAGNTASFAVAVTGTGPLTYQWRKNGSAIGGATGAVYSIATAATTDAGAYTVVISNSAGSATSSAATLTVNPGPAPIAPAITTQPTGLVVIPGTTATLAVAATGTGPLSFQWRRNGTDLPGASTPVLTLTNVSGADAGNYSVVVSNAAGSVISVNAPLILIGAPAITVQPAAATVALGLPASFAVTATGDALQYQWLRNSVAIPGATSAAYTTPPTLAADNGAVYSVIVYNNAGLVISGGALLTVVAPVTSPTITVEPVDQTINDGDFATIVAEVGGSRPLSFQLQRLVGSAWNNIGTALSTSSLLPIAAETPVLAVADSGAQFRVVFSNAAGNVATRTVTVTVNPAVPANALKGIAITAGYRNSFVVAPDRTVWAWGEGVDATTGHYNVSGLWTQWALRPVQVAGLAGVVKVATSQADGTASRAHYALHTDGTVSAWGNNNYGQLGDGTVAIDRIAPVKVMDGALPIDKVCDIAAGNAILVAIRSDEADGSCGPGKARRAWIAGLFVGSVVGGLAVPSATHPYNGAIARPAPGLPAGVPVARISVPDAAFANAAVLFFLEDGRVFAWGWNYDNALGGGGALNIGIASAAGTSAEVTSFWGNAEWAEIGNSFTISRHTDGTLRSVGRNAFGQLADGVSSGASRTTLQNVVTPVTLATAPQALSVGHETVLAIERVNGALWGWGDGYGLISSTPNEAVLAPRRIGTGIGFQAVSAGNRHALAIGPGNVIYAWGFRESGGLGDGSTTGYSLTPTMVTR